ncbi:Leucine-rich repeat domain, L domain-like [Phytophthora cactorum]|nr:Leucine-rich repeat domain, L domain-like [Phytophthora cactorum]
MIILAEQHLTRGFGLEIFPFISSPVVSTSLTVLDLSFNELDDVFWAHWTPDLRETAWPALTTLNLANNQHWTSRPIRYDRVQTIEVLNYHLEQLDLSGNEMARKGLMNVGLFLALQPPLKVLNLSNNFITAEGLEPNAKLHELLLDHNQITDDGAKQLYLKAFKANQQRRIRLSVGNPLTSECKNMLAAISQAHDLRKRFIKEFADQEKLDLSGRSLRQYGVAAIVEELRETPSSKCRYLDLSRNGIGDEGAHAVATLLRAYPRLEELDLSFNDIGDEGAFELADALAENYTLVILSLHSVIEGSQVKPKLQEKGLCRLAHAIQNHKALQKLDLRNNATSSAVIRAYVEMLRCNQGIQKFNGTSSAVFLSRYEMT